MKEQPYARNYFTVIFHQDIRNCEGRRMFVFVLGFYISLQIAMRINATQR